MGEEVKDKEAMSKVRLRVGIVASRGAPGRDDLTKEVEFVGEEVGACTVQHIDPETCEPVEYQGFDQTLYRLTDGRLLVYEEDWWRGQPSITSIVVVEEVDLRPGGRFAALGEASGYGPPPSPARRGPLL